MPAVTSVLPVTEGEDLFVKKDGASTTSKSSFGAMGAATFAKKLKAKSKKKVDHELRNMLIAFIPLFGLIGLAAFILQLIEYDNEMSDALAFVEQSDVLARNVQGMLDRTTGTLDIENMDRIHAPVDGHDTWYNSRLVDPTAGNSSSLFNWTMTVKSVHCYKNGTVEVLTKPVSITFLFLSF